MDVNDPSPIGLMDTLKQPSTKREEGWHTACVRRATLSNLISSRPCSQTMNSLRPCVFHNDVVDNNTVHETAYIYRAISPSDQSLFGHSLQPATVPESYIPKNWYSTEFQPTRSSVDTWTGMVTS
ncbi:uncharacterized protein LOC124151230 isoform X1 [Haliotis rufescens]|uniref:uncharacterized protein LOC124151230 isoform X1 n=1 Tax=Haliotis rufescens TaxID=6454 RepID=UPI001EAFFF50|nr:uncharacterized protein LOC124151230 isoform X1 [Haliotis rufescens]